MSQKLLSGFDVPQDFEESGDASGYAGGVN